MIRKDSILHLKIPRNFEKKDSSGCTIGIPYEQRNLYVFYLYVKKISRFGIIHKSHLPKRKYHHWLDKLVSVGFAEQKGDYYYLESYKTVWRLLGIKRLNSKSKVKLYSYRKVDIYQMVDSWPEFKRKVIEDIFGFQTERKKAQFRKRLSLLRTSTAETASKLCPLFSSQSAAKLFGYKSDHTGWKYRERYFDIVPEPTVVRLKETSDGYPYLQADCKRIYLKTIYH